MARRGTSQVMVYVTTLGQVVIGEVGERSGGGNIDLEAIVVHNPRVLVMSPQEDGGVTVAFPKPSPFLMGDHFKVHRSNIVFEWTASKPQAEMYRSAISNIIVGELAMDMAGNLPDIEE